MIGNDAQPIDYMIKARESKTKLCNLIILYWTTN